VEIKAVAQVPQRLFWYYLTKDHWRLGLTYCTQIENIVLVKKSNGSTSLKWSIFGWGDIVQIS
jgi:hypothetical protein